LVPFFPQLSKEENLLPTGIRVVVTDFPINGDFNTEIAAFMADVVDRNNILSVKNARLVVTIDPRALGLGTQVVEHEGVWWAGEVTVGRDNVGTGGGVRNGRAAEGAAIEESSANVQDDAESHRRCEDGSHAVVMMRKRSEVLKWGKADLVTIVLMGSSGPVGVMTNQKITLARLTTIIALRIGRSVSIKVARIREWDLQRRG
jgi:hypothetical protein